MNEKILTQTDIYYTEKILQYGNTNLGVDWNSIESQELRFEQLSKVLSKNRDMEMSICDYGCGYGAYYDYLVNRQMNINYTGIDISEKMIKSAVEQHQGKGRFINAGYIEEKYDYIIASGIFNVKLDIRDNEWMSYIWETLNMFDKKSTKGFAFNCLTKYSDKEYMRNDLFYTDPLVLFDYAKKYFSRNVALLHDYDLYEFTLIVRK